MNWAYAYFGCQPPNAERDGFLLGGPTMMIQLININKQSHNMSHVQYIHWSISHWLAQPLTINPKPNHCSNGCCILQGAAGDPCRAPHARDKRHARRGEWWWDVWDEWCVMRSGARWCWGGEGEAEAGGERRDPSEKQEPHTVMWGKMWKKNKFTHKFEILFKESF